MKRHLFFCFMVLLISLSGCANKTPEEGAVGVINGESITSEMVEDKIKDLLLQKDMQKTNLEYLQKIERSEKIEEMILQTEEKLAAEITPNLAFNQLAREIVQEQEAKRQGLTVPDAEIEKMIEQSRETEKMIDKESEDYRMMQEYKNKLMDVKDLKTEKEYEDYLRGRMKKRFPIGLLKETFKEKMAESLAKEHPELIGEKFRPALEEKYQEYLEELLASAKVEIIDENFSIEPMK
ncbi:MAG: hypothetical protein AAGU27_24015 [Dehalobacterium sp.]